jgi:2-iminobutanoate/2-iminopropanoate deaminase
LFIRATARIAFIVALGILSACSSSGPISAPWIPQGPGDSPDKVQPRRAPPPRAAEAPRPAPAAAPAAQADAAAGTRFGSARPGLDAYAQARRHENLVFVSGQIALDMGTNQIRGARIDEQMSQVMENIAAILESHRLTMANVVAVTVYLKDLNDFRGMDAVFEGYFRGSPPARSVVEVSRLPRGALVEVSVIAGR